MRNGSLCQFFYLLYMILWKKTVTAYGQCGNGDEAPRRQAASIVRESGEYRSQITCAASPGRALSTFASAADDQKKCLCAAGWHKLLLFNHLSLASLRNAPFMRWTCPYSHKKRQMPMPVLASVWYTSFRLVETGRGTAAAALAGRTAAAAALAGVAAV